VVTHTNIEPYNTGGRGNEDSYPTGGTGVEDSYMQLPKDSAGAIVENKTKLPADSAGAIVENKTKPHMDDPGLIRELDAIKHGINNHVRSFFGVERRHVVAVDNQAVAAKVARLPSGGLGLPESQIAARLESQNGRPEILRAIIARVLVTRMGLEAPQDETLLPRSIAGTLALIPRIAPNDSGTYPVCMFIVPKLTGRLQLIWPS